MAKRKWQQEMERALEEPKGESLENKAKVRGTRLLLRLAALEHHVACR